MGDKGFDDPNKCRQGSGSSNDGCPLQREASDPNFYRQNWNEIPGRNDVPRDFATRDALPSPVDNYNNSGLDRTTLQMYARKYGQPAPPADPFTLALREANRGNRFAMELCTAAVLGGGQQYRVGNQPYIFSGGNQGCFGNGDIFRQIPVPGSPRWQTRPNGDWGFNNGSGPVLRDSNSDIYFPGGSTHHSETVIGQDGRPVDDGWSRDGSRDGDPTRGMSAEDLLIYSGAARNILEAIAIMKGRQVPGGNFMGADIFGSVFGGNRGPLWNGSYDGNYSGWDPRWQTGGWNGGWNGGNNTHIYAGGQDVYQGSSDVIFPGGAVSRDETVVGSGASRRGQGGNRRSGGNMSAEDILVGSGAVRNVLEGVAILKGKHPGVRPYYGR
ncbi:MAG: hypothetical protein KC777_18965 [Cyanobacteria bacterium HKST-UBA02]|nr:hypothetical protein [Cyanobacteria bacterium HKST-UBA02]